MLIDLQNHFVYAPKDQTETQKRDWQQYYDRVQGLVVPNNKTLLERFREEGMYVIHVTIQSHLSTGKDRSKSHLRGQFNDIHLIEDAEGTMIIEKLKPIKDEIIVTKTTHSALTGSNVRLILNNLEITDVVVGGLLTDQCVSSTVRSLSDENYSVWVVEDACMAGNIELHEHVLEIMNNTYCNVVNTEEVLAVL
ncbi:cysteine hydrolase family protein [Streptococcus pluranimalium]|uniref:cysteine hydrolase family protein n=1 Tax=Streptococcus pluranimalium TaxID=82348 RepID=UPI003F68D8B4